MVSPFPGGKMIYGNEPNEILPLYNEAQVSQARGGNQPSSGNSLLTNELPHVTIRLEAARIGQ